jgi:hypothetical protein
MVVAAGAPANDPHVLGFFETVLRDTPPMV